MNSDFFSKLPSEIIFDILSRLPVRTIMNCKRVCKSWLNLVESDAFAKCHFSKSVQGLALCQYLPQSNWYEVYEFEDAINLESHDLHYIPVTKFDLPFHGGIHGSCDGLLFLRDLNGSPSPLYICNPITREYFKFHYPEENAHMDPEVVACGFGASKLTGHHKVLRISHDRSFDQERNELLEIGIPECQVYTLETGLWRNIAPASGAPLDYLTMDNLGVFVNGNLHWLVQDLNNYLWISCFDLDTEVFSRFYYPPQRYKRYSLDIVALGGRLCVCYNSTHYNDILIWSMEEYGVEDSWTKKFVTRRSPDVFGVDYNVIYAIKVFKDGDVLMSLDNSHFFHYSKKDDTTKKIAKFEKPYYHSAILHKPSFLSLKCFGMENITSF